MIGTEAYSLSHAFGNFLDGLVVFLIGVSMVFFTLVLLIFLIKLLGYLTSEKKPKQAQVSAKIEVEAIKEKQVEVSQSEKASDDLELVAVITAAIAASLEVSTDQLIVKSLRKVNRE